MPNKVSVHRGTMTNYDKDQSYILLYLFINHNKYQGETGFDKLDINEIKVAIRKTPNHEGWT